ncbi:MAG: sodium/proline symporter [Lachnospiraceae bacterium]|nr:sodium/proline symporter [Lachnospiraceae bacterium]
MSSATVIIMIVMFVYLAGMVAIGIIFSKSSNTTADFYLGGRKLGPLVTAMSAEASDMSSWLLMGLPGVALLAGMPEATWTALGLGVGTYINWLIVARRIRRYSQKLGAVTVPDYFSRRYHDEKHLLSLVSALVIIVFFIPYVASGFNACGTLFASLFDVDYFPSMLVAAIVIMAYTSLGGFMAASTSDLVQSVVMTIALAIVVIFGISSAGGWGAVAANASSMPGYLNLFQGYDAAAGTAAVYGPLTIASTLAWGLGYFGMPHILLRFMAIEDPGKLKTSRRIATVWVFLSMGVAILIGIVGSAVISAGRIDALDSGNSQRIIIRLAQLLSTHGTLAAIVAGLILSGILAATMSTADSQLLAAASSVTEDLVAGFFGRKLSKETSMKIARLTVLVIALVAVIWARKEGSVFSIVSFAWAGFGAAFGPTVLLSLFWKRSNRQGALCGMIAGGAMVFIWEYLISPLGGIWGIYELLPAFCFGLIVNVVVSLATGEPEAAITAEYEEVMKEQA